MKLVVVTGSRDATIGHERLVHQALREAGADVVFHGGCGGVDALASRYSCKKKAFPADWKTHGKAAGPIRNRAMLEAAKALESRGWEVLVIAFPSSGSRGTRDAMKQAETLGLKVKEVPLPF